MILGLRGDFPSSWGVRRFFWWGFRTAEEVSAEKTRSRERRTLKSREMISRPSGVRDQILLQKDSAQDVIVVEEEKRSSLAVRSDAGGDMRQSYLPSRIDNEVEIFRDRTKGSLMERTHAEWAKKFQKPIFPYFINYDYYVEEKRKKTYSALLQVQKLQEERLFELGPDISAAWFLLTRNCKIRFKGMASWLEADDRGKIEGHVPSVFEKGYYLEAVEASRSLLIYEGLQNMRNLAFLKYLDISYCEMIDEWCLDRIVGEFRETLEFLDISGCYKVDWNGIECLARLKKLKVLVLRDLNHIENLKLLCLLLLEIKPELEIRGVDYMDVSVLESSEEKYILQDLERELLLIEGGDNK